MSGFVCSVSSQYRARRLLRIDILASNFEMFQRLLGNPIVRLDFSKPHELVATLLCISKVHEVARQQESQPFCSIYLWPLLTLKIISCNTCDKGLVWLRCKMHLTKTANMSGPAIMRNYNTSHWLMGRRRQMQLVAHLLYPLQNVCIKFIFRLL